jgi:hypothetical protein
MGIPWGKPSVFFPSLETYSRNKTIYTFENLYVKNSDVMGEVGVEVVVVVARRDIPGVCASHLAS